MTLALVVPAYRRPTELARCLRAAFSQDQPFAQVVVAGRLGDDETLAVAERAGATVVTTEAPGVLAAMAAGVRATTATLIGFTDDDAVLPATWSARVAAFFAQPGHENVGGFGGRDRLFDGDVPRPCALTERVGTITYVGRVIGNHHCGTGAPRDVAVLKGVNAAYRREAIGLPASLRGDGAQAHFELSLGAYARSRGWRLVYDPTLTVEHHPAPRRGDDQRQWPTPQAVSDSAFNVMRALPARQQTRRWLYVHAWGDSACPGLVRCAVALATRDRTVAARRRASWRGTTAAWRDRHTSEHFQTFS